MVNFRMKLYMIFKPSTAIKFAKRYWFVYVCQSYICIYEYANEFIIMALQWQYGKIHTWEMVLLCFTLHTG